MSEATGRLKIAELLSRHQIYIDLADAERDADVGKLPRRLAELISLRCSAVCGLRRHFVTYIRLLDAMDFGANDQEICCILLGINSAKEPERAKRARLSHLRRARWMTENGYRRLLQ